MRQSGVLAAACLYALDHNIARLADDHEAAVMLATEVAHRAPEAITARPQTNIVAISTGARPSAEVVAAAKDAGVIVSRVGPHTVRAVTHMGVTPEQCQQAGITLGRLLG